jgi:hypothetical protein
MGLELNVESGNALAESRLWNTEIKELGREKNLNEHRTEHKQGRRWSLRNGFMCNSSISTYSKQGTKPNWFLS